MDWARCSIICSPVIHRLLAEQPTTRFGYFWKPSHGNRALWNAKIDRDLTTICLKCLEKDPQRRYPSALALAEDLERWLKHEPIRARRTGMFGRGRKWVRRNPTIALLILSLTALTAAVSWNVWKSEFVHPPLQRRVSLYYLLKISATIKKTHFLPMASRTMF